VECEERELQIQGTVTLYTLCTNSVFFLGTSVSDVGEESSTMSRNSYYSVSDVKLTLPVHRTDYSVSRKKETKMFLVISQTNLGRSS